jgi:hypothetical protein
MNEFCESGIAMEMDNVWPEEKGMNPNASASESVSD